MVSSVGDVSYPFSKKEYEAAKREIINDYISDVDENLKKVLPDEYVIKESFKSRITKKSVIENIEKEFDFSKLCFTKEDLVNNDSYNTLINKIKNLIDQGRELRKEYSVFNNQLEKYIEDIEAGKKVPLDKVEEWLASKNVIKFIYESPVKKYVGVWAYEQSQSRLAEIYRLINADKTPSAMSLKGKIDLILPKAIFPDDNQKVTDFFKKRMKAHLKEVLPDEYVIKESFKSRLTKEVVKKNIEERLEKYGIEKDELVECALYEDLTDRINSLIDQGRDLHKEYLDFNNQLEKYIEDIETGEKVPLNKVEEWLLSKNVLKFFYKSPMKKYVGLWAVEQSQSRLAEMYRLIRTDETTSAMSLKRKIDRILPKALFPDVNQKVPRSLKKRMESISLPEVIQSEICKSLNSSTPTEIANSLKIIEEMTNPGEMRTKLIIQWVNQEKIPLALLNLDKDKLYGIVVSKQFKVGTSLTHIDLRGCFEKETWTRKEKEELLKSIEPKYVKSLFIDNRTDLMKLLPAELSRFLPFDKATVRPFMLRKAKALGMNAEGAPGFHLIADWINEQRIPLRKFHFNKIQMQQIFPLLRHADLTKCKCIAEFESGELLSLIESAAKNLVHLKINSLKLKELPNSFPKLRYLGIDGSRVQELPKSCPELTKFDCHRSANYLSAIPLHYLRHLTANIPSLGIIFSEFSKRKLGALDDETIKFVANWINEKEIPLKTLISSEQFMCIIKEKPKELGSFLQHLDLTNFFNENSGYARKGVTTKMINDLLEHTTSSLRFLKLDRESPITVLPEDFSELRILECHSPNLRVLPKKCSKLVELDCSNSTLIKELPHGPKLEKLVCGGCTQLTVRQIYPRVDSAQMRKILGKK